MTNHDPSYNHPLQCKVSGSEAHDALQNLDVHLDLRNLSEEIAQSFWTVLAQLTALSQLLVGVIEMAEVDFWRSLPLLTQLR